MSQLELSKLGYVHATGLWVAIGLCSAKKKLVCCVCASCGLHLTAGMLGTDRHADSDARLLRPPGDPLYPMLVHYVRTYDL